MDRHPSATECDPARFPLPPAPPGARVVAVTEQGAAVVALVEVRVDGEKIMVRATSYGYESTGPNTFWHRTEFACEPPVPASCPFSDARK